MYYRVFADIIVVIHFIWILFMLVGFGITLYAVMLNKLLLYKWSLFRIIHLLGIIYVSGLTVLDKYCPLTILEYNLRKKIQDGLTYHGSFIAVWIEKLVYPDVNPIIIQIPTILIAVFTIVIFMVYPPWVEVEQKK